MPRGKKGVDLSNWQAALGSAAPLTDAGAEFAILKLSEGRGFADGSFSRFYDMCREAGIAVGAYVYSHSADADGNEICTVFAWRDYALLEEFQRQYEELIAQQEDMKAALELLGVSDEEAPA